MLVGAVVGARVGSPGNGVGCNEEGEQEGLPVGIGEEEGATEDDGKKLDDDDGPALGAHEDVNEGASVGAPGNGEGSYVLGDDDGPALGAYEDVNEGASVGAPGNGEG